MTLFIVKTLQNMTLCCSG